MARARAEPVWEAQAAHRPEKLACPGHLAPPPPRLLSVGKAGLAERHRYLPFSPFPLLGVPDWSLDFLAAGLALYLDWVLNFLAAGLVFFLVRVLEKKAPAWEGYLMELVMCRRGAARPGPPGQGARGSASPAPHTSRTKAASDREAGSRSRSHREGAMRLTAPPSSS